MSNKSFWLKQKIEELKLTSIDIERIEEKTAIKIFDGGLAWVQAEKQAIEEFLKEKGRR